VRSWISHGFSCRARSSSTIGRRPSPGMSLRRAEQEPRNIGRFSAKLVTPLRGYHMRAPHTSQRRRFRGARAHTKARAWRGPPSSHHERSGLSAPEIEAIERRQDSFSAQGRKSIRRPIDRSGHRVAAWIIQLARNLAHATRIDDLVGPGNRLGVDVIPGDQPVDSVPAGTSQLKSCKREKGK
jgi:hypothetical protein